MREQSFIHECTIELDVKVHVTVTPGERMVLSPIRLAHPGSYPEVSIDRIVLGDMDITELVDDATLDSMTQPTPPGKTYANEYELILEAAEEHAQGDW